MRTWLNAETIVCLILCIISSLFHFFNEKILGEFYFIINQSIDYLKLKLKQLIVSAKILIF